MSNEDDVLKMVEHMQQDAKYGPFELYCTDKMLRQMGFTPEDYPELEGYPGVRVLRSKGTQR